VADLGGIVRILRPVPATASAATVWVGATTETGRVALLSGAIFLTVAVANVYNDIRDVEADRVNRRPRPIAQGSLTVRHAWAILFVCVAGALALAAAAGWAVLLADAGLVLASLAYSRWLKGTVLLGNAVVAALGSMPILLGGLITGAPLVRVTSAQGLLLAYMFSYEILKSLRDASGDAAVGYRTVATRWNLRRGLTVWLVTVAAFLALSVGFGLTYDLGWAYQILMTGAVDGTLVVLAVCVWTRRTTIARAVTVCTLIWLPGLLAMGRLG
jgi:4-hydroxybenzoate polyprenyltransferase